MDNDQKYTICYSFKNKMGISANNFVILELIKHGSIMYTRKLQATEATTFDYTAPATGEYTWRMRSSSIGTTTTQPITYSLDNLSIFYSYPYTVENCDNLADGYRFGFGGHEKDNEVSGEGNHLSFGDFGLDTRLGRRWNVEPLIKKYPNFSSYLVFANNPIIYTDPDGFDWILASGSKVTWYGGEYGNTKTVIKVFKATSGHSSVPAIVGGKPTTVNCQNSNYQYVKDNGPTVEGKYKLNLAPDIEKATIKDGQIVSGQGKGIQNLENMEDPAKPGVVYNSTAWGKNRISLIPVNVKQPAENTATPTKDDDRDLNSFYFHDSQKGESSGCHEVEPSFFDMLKTYKEAGNKEIQVKVEYKKNQSTNGGTKKKTP